MRNCAAQTTLDRIRYNRSRALAPACRRVRTIANVNRAFFSVDGVHDSGFRTARVDADNY
jgi:hypothetical protein